MLKKMLPLVLGPMLLAGCATKFTITNLTPLQQVRNRDNVYTVEVAVSTRQQTIRWDSIRPQIVVGRETYPMRPTPLLTNRWEGLLPVPADTSIIHYRYKFDFDYNTFGRPKADSAVSSEYTLRIIE